METSLSIHPLPETQDNVREEMVFLPMETVRSKWVTPGGRLIRPTKCAFPANSPSDLTEICVVQHGLPGDSWRVQMEEKARQAIQDGLEAAFYFLIPGGTRGAYDLGKGMDLEETDSREVHESQPLFFHQPFSFPRYARTLHAAAAGLRKYISSDCRVHLVGHSYGALGLLYALGLAARDGRSNIASANFLSPFVQVTLDTYDPNIALNVINTSAAVEGVQSESSVANQIGVLRSILAKLQRFYHLTEPVRNPIEWHRDVFGRQFFEAVGDLRPVVQGATPIDVRVFRGERDLYIDERHGDLIAKLMGLTRSDIEKVFPDDGHDIASLDVKELVK